MALTVQQVIALLPQPELLLRRCFIAIAGGAGPAPANGQASVATFKVSVDATKTPRGFTTGISGFFGKRKDRTFVRFTKLAGVAKVAPAADEFNAYYVPMVQVADAASLSSHYTLPTGGGALDLMITSKLSGCTFGVGSDAAGATLVSHIQPNLATANLAQRATDLDTAMTGGFHAVTGQFRKRQEYDEYATVIGRRTGTQWRFYMQANNYQNSTDVISRVQTVG